MRLRPGPFIWGSLAMAAAMSLTLAASVFYADNTASAALVGECALLGLLGAFLVQALWLKGKPMPGMPPIALLSLIGLVVATVFLK